MKIDYIKNISLQLHFCFRTQERNKYPLIVCYRRSLTREAPLRVEHD